MATTKTQVGVPWDGRTAYERWVEDDLKLDLHRGYSASGLKAVAVKPWAERGISAAFYDITGAESLARAAHGHGRCSQLRSQTSDWVGHYNGVRGPRHHQDRCQSSVFSYAIARRPRRGEACSTTWRPIGSLHEQGPVSPVSRSR